MTHNRFQGTYYSRSPPTDQPGKDTATKTFIISSEQILFVWSIYYAKGPKKTFKYDTIKQSYRLVRKILPFWRKFEPTYLLIFIQIKPPPPLYDVNE